MQLRDENGIFVCGHQVVEFLEKVFRFPVSMNR